MKNYKNIIEHFDKIIEVKQDKLSVTTTGIKDNKESNYISLYKHEEVAKEVATKIEYFKGI